MRRVVITGLAPLFPIGQGKEEFFRNLLDGHIVMKEIPDGYCYGEIASKWYVPYPEIDFSAYDRKIQKMTAMSPKNASTSFISALLAVKDAGLEKLNDDTGVFWGLGAPNITEINRILNNASVQRPLHPCSIPMMMPSSASAWIAVMLGLHGENMVCSTACASGTTAVGHAYQYIQSGKSDMAVCGGSECFCGDGGAILKAFDVLGAVSGSADGYPRPFSENRSGFLYSEGGACALILEEYESAVLRGADIYAEITGYESCCDGYHIVQMPDNADNIINMIQKLVGDDVVDYYNAHGTGTVVNDRNEAEMIKKLFGTKTYVNSSKGILGHTIGASGAVETAICAYSIKHGIIHRNITDSPIDGINLPLENVRADINVAVSSSFGFGGNNSAIKLKKVAG